MESKGNSGAAWGVVRDLIPGLKNVNNRLVSNNPLDKANEFN